MMVDLGLVSLSSEVSLFSYSNLKFVQGYFVFFRFKIIGCITHHRN